MKVMLAVLGLAVLPATAQQQPLDGPRVLDLLNTRVNTERKSVGIAVGILSAEGRRLVAVGNHGIKDGREIDADTVFEIGGLSDVVQRVLAEPMKTPLRMPDTSATPTAEMASRLAAGHTAALIPVSRSNASTTLYSTIADLLNLVAAMTGLSQADGEIVFHEGQTAGFASAIALDPNAHTAVVVLSNSAAPVGDIAKHVLRPSIPLTRSSSPTVTVDVKMLDAYVGRYETPAGVYAVGRDADGLTLTMPGLPPLRLLPQGPREFAVAENSRVTVTFSVTAAGSISALVLKSPTGSVTAKRM